MTKEQLIPAFEKDPQDSDYVRELRSKARAEDNGCLWISDVELSKVSKGNKQMTPPSDALEALTEIMLSNQFYGEISDEEHEQLVADTRNLAKRFSNDLYRRGFTIAPLARVTDERLREALNRMKSAYDNIQRNKQTFGVEVNQSPEYVKAVLLIETALSELQARRDAEKGGV